MSKTVELKINNFSGGISDDPRKDSGSEFIITKHFDIFSNPLRLTPYRSLEADTNDGSTATGMKQYDVKDFVYASGSAKLYGLGKVVATGKTKLFFKADATTGNWTLPANSQGDALVKNGCLIEYKDYLWGFQGTNQIFKWGALSATPSITDSASTTGVTITSIAQGLVFNDYLYLPYNNKIWRATDATTFSDAYLTLPSNFKITSLCQWGKYIAIALAPVSTYNGTSKVALWDGTSTDIQEIIDWGEGELRIIETIEGYIVGVTDRYLNSAVGAGRGSMIIQIYSGGTPQVIKEVFTQVLSGKTMPQSKAVRNNRVFFSAKIMSNSAGTEYNEGIWSFGRKNVNYPFTLTLDQIDENVSATGIQSFGTAGNYFFINHSGDGSIDKTNDAATYAFTSIYESQIFNFGDTEKDKRLEFIRLHFRKLATNEVFTVKMKVDDATSWTTVGTFGTAGELSKTFTCIEATDANFASGKEFKFQFTSTGGGEITGFSLKATVLDAI